MSKVDILNLFDEFQDYQDSLSDVVCEYQIGKHKIVFLKPLALSKQNKDKLIRNQFLSQAVANEYNLLQDEYKDILNNNLTRETAERAFELRIQSDNKLIELNLLTVEYLELLGNLNKGELIDIITSQLPSTLVKVEISDFINKMFNTITGKLSTTEIDANEVKFDEGKKPLLNESENIVNNSETNYTSSEDTTGYLVMTH